MKKTALWQLYPGAPGAIRPFFLVQVVLIVVLIAVPLVVYLRPHGWRVLPPRDAGAGVFAVLD